MKNSSDTIGNRTPIFRLVAQCLIQLRHRVPPEIDLHTTIYRVMQKNDRLSPERLAVEGLKVLELIFK